MEKCSRCKINEAEIKCNKCKAKYCKICDYYMHTIMKKDVHNKKNTKNINDIPVKQTEQSINIQSYKNVNNKNSNKQYNSTIETNKDKNKIDNNKLDINKKYNNKAFNDITSFHELN